MAKLYNKVTLSTVFGICKVDNFAFYMYIIYRKFYFVSEDKMNAQIQKEIIGNLQYLDSFQLSEVLDFVVFLHHRCKEKLPEPEAIDAICGKYRHRLSSSLDFAQRKQEEIKMEEEKWKRR
jgi:hypothetical protein